MLSSTAIVSLACLLSSGEADSNATARLAETLSQQEAVLVEKVQLSGACLPEKFDKLISPEALKSLVASPTSDAGS